MTEPSSITRLLIDWSNGDQAALEQLTPQMHQELYAFCTIVSPTATIRVNLFRLPRGVGNECSKAMPGHASVLIVMVALF